MQWPLPNSAVKALVASRTGSGFNPATVTASSTINTKGSWATHGSAISTGATGILLTVVSVASATDNTDTSMLMDIGFRSGGNDYVLIPNYPIGWQTTNRTCTFIPLTIPNGGQLEFRAQSVIASKQVGVQADVVGGEPVAGLSVPTKFTDYGTVLSSSTGTAITPSATINTKGSWTEITSSTTSPIHEMLLGVQGVATNLSAGAFGMIDIGVGASGSEQVVMSNWTFLATSSEQIQYTYPNYLPFRYNIPAGSRIAARMSFGAANGPSYALSVIGVTY